MPYNEKELLKLNWVYLIKKKSKSFNVRQKSNILVFKYFLLLLSNTYRNFKDPEIEITDLYIIKGVPRSIGGQKCKTD